MQEHASLLGVVAEPSHFLPARLGHTSWLATASSQALSSDLFTEGPLQRQKWAGGAQATLLP